MTVFGVICLVRRPRVPFAIRSKWRREKEVKENPRVETVERLRKMREKREKEMYSSDMG